MNRIAVAYAALLASVSDDQVIDFREGRRSVLEPESSMRFSHVLAYWIYREDLRTLLSHAIDGGQFLRDDLWHPLRVPIWHPSAATAEIERNLHECRGRLLKESGPSGASDWYIVEVTKVMKVFTHAAKSGGGIVSFLDKPMDEARAKRVLIPVAERPLTG